MNNNIQEKREYNIDYYERHLNRKLSKRGNIYDNISGVTEEEKLMFIDRDNSIINKLILKSGLFNKNQSFSTCF